MQTLRNAINDWSVDEFVEKFGDGQHESYAEKLARETAERTQKIRAAKESITALTKHYTLTAEFADRTEALNWILVFCEIPESLRSFVDALIGIAGEHCGDRSSDGWFDAPHILVGERARLAQGGATDAAHERWTSRRLAEFLSIQDAASRNLIEVVEGDFDRQTQRNRPTRYRLPLLEYVDETIELARTLREWRTGDTRAAIKRAAREVVNGIPDAPLVQRRRIRVPPDPRDRVSKNLKTMLTLAAKIRDDLALINAQNEASAITTEAERARYDLDNFFLQLNRQLHTRFYAPPGLAGAVLRDDTAMDAVADGVTDVSPRQDSDLEPDTTVEDGTTEDVRRGDTPVTPSEPMTGAKVAEFPDARTDNIVAGDGVTHLSPHPLLYEDSQIGERREEIKQLVAQFLRNLTLKYPVDYDPAAAGGAEARQAVNQAMIDYALGTINLSEVRDALRAYHAAHVHLVAQRPASPAT